MFHGAALVPRALALTIHPMRESDHLLASNRARAERVERELPGLCRDVAAQQRPKYLWIGCSDSRVPANEIIGLMLG
jgi:carbonic anhydrase